MNINAIEEISKAFLFKLNDMSSSKMPPDYFNAYEIGEKLGFEKLKLMIL